MVVSLNSHRSEILIWSPSREKTCSGAPQPCEDKPALPPLNCRENLLHQAPKHLHLHQSCCNYERLISMLSNHFFPSAFLRCQVVVPPRNFRTSNAKCPASGYQIMPNCPKFSGNLETRFGSHSHSHAPATEKTTAVLPVGNHSQKKIGSKAS